MKKSVIAQDKSHLKSLVKEAMILYGNECDMSHIDTSLVTDMSYLFDESKFNGDISGWNVSQVKNMDSMFWFSQFNGDISQWNVSNVQNISAMFSHSQFNRNINDWDISKVTDIRSMFNQCQCEKPWWYIEDNKKRKEVMEKYELMNNLDKEMNNKEITQSKKNKL